MAPPSSLYTYAPTPNFIKAAGNLDTPIVIMFNNVAFSPEIPKKYVNKGFKDLVAYLSACPLRYALSNVVDPFLLQHVCEFYYTFACNDVRVIFGIIDDGNYPISTIGRDIQRALQPPVRDEYSPLSTMA